MIYRQAIIAVAGLISAIVVAYMRWWSPQAKARREALKDGQAAIKKQDASGVTSAFDKLNRLILIGFCFLFFAGCSQKIIIHPIAQIDIIEVNEGQTFKAPKKGWFVSDLYMEEVMQAKVEK